MSKMVYKGVGPRDVASPYKTLLITPSSGTPGA